MSGRILVVDDDPVLLSLFTEVLPSHGYTICAAPTVQDVFKLLPVERPDVLILDYMLPDGTGLEVCRQVRADPSFAALRILIITAQANARIQAECRLAGADDYLAKPLQLSDLLNHINALLK